MRLSPLVARGYVAQHGADLEAHGITVYTEDWERVEADELAGLAIDGGRAA